MEVAAALRSTRPSCLLNRRTTIATRRCNTHNQRRHPLLCCKDCISTAPHPLTILLALLATATLLYTLAPHIPLLSSLTTQPPAPPIIARHAELADSTTAHPSASLSKRVHLAASLLPNLQQFAVATFQPHSTTERHVHPSLSEVFHVLAGEVRFCFDGGREEVVGVGDTVAVPPGTWHTVVNDGDVELRMVYASVLV